MYLRFLNLSKLYIQQFYLGELNQATLVEKRQNYKILRPQRSFISWSLLEFKIVLFKIIN